MPASPAVLAGKALKGRYICGVPFPHIALNNFFDMERLREVENEVKAFAYFDGEKDFWGARRKRYCGSPESFPPKVRDFIAFCNSQMFLDFLEAMTGETDLVADPYFEGGGLHSLRNGGFLKVHPILTGIDGWAYTED